MCRGIIKYLAGEARKPGSYGLRRVSGGPRRQRLLAARAAEPATGGSSVRTPGG